MQVFEYRSDYKQRRDSDCKICIDAWGKVLSITDNAGNAITDKNHVAQVNPLRYRGYCYDAESGMYYLGSRYYSPDMCRFLNTDGDVSTGQGMTGTNLFTYCGNNPISMTDDNGYWPKWATKILIGAAAIVVGAAVVAATAATGGAAAAFVGAAVAGVKAAVISSAVGAGTSVVSHRISTGSWKGSGKTALGGAVNGFADGFMTGRDNGRRVTSA